MKRNIIILGALVIAFLTIGAVWLHAQQEPHPAVSVPPKQAPVGVETSTIAQVILNNTSTPATPAAVSTTPTVGTPVATPSMIAVNTSRPVTVTVQITGPTLIPGSVNLLLLGATGTQPTILGAMRSAGNGAYSLQSVFTEQMPGTIQLEVSAAFQGSLKRVLSNVVTVGVWGVVSNASSGFQALYPPSLYDLSNTTSFGGFLLQSSQQGVDIGGEGPEDGSNATTSGFSIVIQPTPYTGTFDINSWLSAAYQGSNIGSLATTSIGEQPGYVFTLSDEVGAGEPTAVVYHNGYVYKIAYSSTFALGSSADANGLSAFNAVLQNFTFLN